MPTYRQGRLRDIRVLPEIMEESLREHGLGDYSEEEIMAVVDKNASRLARVLLGRRTPTVVAEEDGNIVGYAVVDANTCTLTQLYVRPSLVRNGLGSALLERAEQRAVNAGCDILYIYASLNAIEFYEKQGYERLEHATIETETVDVPSILVQKFL